MSPKLTWYGVRNCQILSSVDFSSVVLNVNIGFGTGGANGTSNMPIKFSYLWRSERHLVHLWYSMDTGRTNDYLHGAFRKIMKKEGGWVGIAVYHIDAFDHPHFKVFIFDE